MFGIWAVWAVVYMKTEQDVLAAFTASADSLNRRIAVSNYAAEVAFGDKRGSAIHITPPLPRVAITPYVMAAVYSRVGGVCQHCGSMYDLEYNHVVPYSKGGSNGVNNIQLLCRPCNMRKGNRYAY